MKNAYDLLTLIMDRKNLTSVYAFIAYMQKRHPGRWSKTATYFYLNGKQLPDDAACMDIAEELGIEPAYVLAVVHAQRERSPEVRTVWREIADSFEPRTFYPPADGEKGNGERI